MQSPSKAMNIARQGSKVAEISRQFSRATDLVSQGSGGSDISRQNSRQSDISRQGSSSPQKIGPSRQSSTAAVPPVQSPAKSAALARTSQQAKPTASQTYTHFATTPVSSSPMLAPLAAADAELETAIVDTLAQPVAPGQATVPGTSDNVHQNDTQPPGQSSSYGLAALASFPKIPWLQSGEPPEHDVNQSQPSDVPVALTPHAKDAAGGGAMEMSFFRSGSRAQADLLSVPHHNNLSSSNSQAQTSERPDVNIQMPSERPKSREQVHSTLAAVQKDYVYMIGKQEEVRQAHAAAAADMTDEVAAAEGPEASSNVADAGVADLFEPAYIPAVPAMPRPPGRKGNSALFQMLAAGQPGAAD